VVGAILVVIYFFALAIFSVLMWPIRKIMQNADANPKRTARMMIFLAVGILLVNAFGLPWNFDVLIGGGSTKALFSALGNAGGDVFVALIFNAFFMFFVGLPLLFFKFLGVAFGFSRANPSVFWKLVIVGSVVAVVEYWLRGVMTLRFAIYGLGAFVIYSYLRVLLRN
jgi:hypothetical protein